MTKANIPLLIPTNIFDLVPRDENGLLLFKLINAETFPVSPDDIYEITNHTLENGEPFVVLTLHSDAARILDPAWWIELENRDSAKS